jgi:hypothetical protein
MNTSSINVMGPDELWHKRKIQQAKKKPLFFHAMAGLSTVSSGMGQGI